MQQRRIILLVILGAILGIAGIISSLYMVVFIILAFIVLILLIAEFKKWVESLVEKIAAAKRSNPPEAASMTETFASLRADLQQIDQRLEELERKAR